MNLIENFVISDHGNANHSDTGQSFHLGLTRETVIVFHLLVIRAQKSNNKTDLMLFQAWQATENARKTVPRICTDNEQMKALEMAVRQ